MTTINELSKLKNRRALITGATGFLGQVIAETLSELGADLILVDKPGSDLNYLSEKLIERWAVKIECFECDLENHNKRIDMIDKLKNEGKAINILINNAAFVGTKELEGWAVSFEHQTVETWSRAIEVNLTAIFHLCQGLFPLLRASEGANIINIASIYGVYGPNWSLYEGTNISNPAAYSSSKGGLIQLTRWLATTVAPHVRVNSLSPGGIYRNQEIKFRERYESKTPLGRMANEDDFRGIIAYLASDLSRYVTGQNIVVDGGFGVW